MLFRSELTYSIALANIIPAASAFTVTVDGSARTINAVAVAGTKVTLTLASPVAYGNNVTVAYTKPASNPLQTSTGAQAASLTQQTVTNNVGAVIPAFVSAVIQDATPSILEMTYNLAMANIIPATSAFTVTVNSSAISVSSVAISGTKVLLTLSSPVAGGNLVTVAYSKPAFNPLQTTAGGQASTILAQSVTNNCNQRPTVEISSPTKSTSFIAPATITIEANASDPDGIISKVEFYQGAIKIGESITYPYSFSWKNVQEGTYYIKAVATDNKNLQTTSGIVIVIVEKSASTVNQVPIVNVTIPNKKKPKKHDNIAIIVEAFDPDGSVNLVELKNGNTTIAELTTAPYEFTLTNVDTGNYYITAVATDNRGATSISETLQVRVDEFNDPNDAISLYPNPNYGRFTITIHAELPESNNTITIVSSAGKINYEADFDGNNSTTEIDMTGSTAGNYILMITNKRNVVAIKKFTKL